MLLALLLTVQTKSVRFLPPTPLLINGVPLEVEGGHGVPEVVDLNGDGLEDLAVGQFVDGETQLYINTGTPSRHTFAPPTLLLAGGKPAKVNYGCCIGGAPRFGDLDGDGVTDVVSGSYTGGLYFFRGLGKGKFAASVPLLPKDQIVGNTLAPTLTDWNGDGHLDLIVGTDQGAVLLLKSDGHMHFTTAGKFTSEGKPIVAKDGGPAVYDFNGDGVLDLLVGDVGGMLTIYFGKSKGGTDMSAGKSVLPQDRSQPFPEIRLRPTVFDWNHDGKPDIIFGDYRPDGAPVLPMPKDADERLKMLHASASNAAFQILTRHEALESQAKKEAGITDLSTATKEQLDKYRMTLDAFVANDKELKNLELQKADAERQIASLQAQRPILGTVWVCYGL